MLSDEEKEAIEIIKFLQDKCMQENGTGMMTIYRIDDLANAIKILINLIEKQSKEIEELKEKNEYLPNWVSKKYVSKDKIKAKIDYLLKRYDSEEDFCSYDVLISILQSLLEKE